jgi:hypothetical protein
MVSAMSHKFGGVSQRLDMPDVRRRRAMCYRHTARHRRTSDTAIHPENTDQIYDSGH